MLAVRSNWRPACIEKAASRTTLAQGAWQAAGGVKENNFGEKSANAILLKSCTTQGVVAGRGTGGSAVAVLGEPITRPGAGMAWPKVGAATSITMATTKSLAAIRENVVMDLFAGELSAVNPIALFPEGSMPHAQ